MVDEYRVNSWGLGREGVSNLRDIPLKSRRSRLNQVIAWLSRAGYQVAWLAQYAFHLKSWVFDFADDETACEKKIVGTSHTLAISRIGRDCYEASCYLKRSRAGFIQSYCLFCSRKKKLVLTDPTFCPE